MKWFRASFLHHRVFRASVVSIFAARPEVAWMGREQAHADGEGGCGLGQGCKVAGAKGQTQLKSSQWPVRGWLVRCCCEGLGSLGNGVGGQAEASG